ncbi:Mis6-domain-containing protein [Pilobolus umbonatus]|nr:Mis6-domain-containing protein [Pilobolus umbonatus]
MEDNTVADTDTEINNENENTDLNDVTISNVDDLILSRLKRFHPSVAVTTLRRYHKDIFSIAHIIQRYGLSDSHFDTLFRVALSGRLRQKVAIDLISYLLPRNPIPVEYAVEVIGSINRECDLVVVKHLLRWIISVYEMFDSTDKIKKLYNVLFFHLTLTTIRPEICHLLYFITRRNHVTKYRIRILQQMLEKEKDNEAIIALLMVYKNYNALIRVPQNIRLKNMFVFEHPNPELMNHLMNIRILWANVPDGLSFHFHKPPIEFPEPKKAKSRSYLSRAGESNVLINLSVDLQVTDIIHLIENFESFDFPDQLSSLLENRILQHVIVCNPDEVIISRMSFWISQKIMDQCRWNNRNQKGKHELLELLQKLLVLSRFTKAQLPVIEGFLQAYLLSWNGIDFREEIFELLTFIKPTEYKDLYHTLLKPLYRLYTVSDIYWKAKLISTYTEWLKNWALLDWSRHAEARNRESLNPEADVDRITWLFEGLSFNVDHFSTMQELIQHVDRICSLGLALEYDHPILQHAALAFFELVSSISLQHDIPEIIIPAATLVHRTFFSTNAMAVNRICGIVYQYKRAFEDNDRKTGDWISKHSMSYLDHFNTYVLDICNALWQNRAFTVSDKNKIPFAMAE